MALISDGKGAIRALGILALAACALIASSCGGGGGGSGGMSSPALPPQSASLSVTVAPNPLTVNTYGPAYATATLSAVPAGGAAPYSYVWVSQGTAHSTLSSSTVATPTISATLNWGDSFTDTWQVTVTDAGNKAVSATVAATFTAPVADGMPPGAASAAVQGSIVSDSVSTIAVPGADSYPLRIYLPADYATTSDLLPVIYATDGVADLSDPTQYNGWQVPDMARILEARGVRAIVVGIGGYERRSTDYLMPGATNFYTFVTTELIPYIEKKYRASPANRTLSGHSYGGIFAGLAMMMDRPSNRYFANFLSLDGSYYDQPNVTATMEQTLSGASGGALPNTVLVLSSSTGGNDSYVNAFYQQLQALNIQGWQVTRIPNYNTNHLPMFDEAFSASIAIAYKLPGS